MAVVANCSIVYLLGGPRFYFKLVVVVSPKHPLPHILANKNAHSKLLVLPDVAKFVTHPSMLAQKLVTAYTTNMNGATKNNGNALATHKPSSYFGNPTIFYQ